MRNVIPITCALTIAAVVTGVKLTRHQSAREPIVWYGNAVHPYITEVRAGVEAFAKRSGVGVFRTVGQEWTRTTRT